MTSSIEGQIYPAVIKAGALYVYAEQLDVGDPTLFDAVFSRRENMVQGHVLKRGELLKTWTDAMGKECRCYKRLQMLFQGDFRANDKGTVWFASDWVEVQQ